MREHGVEYREGVAALDGGEVGSNGDVLHVAGLTALAGGGSGWVD